MRVEDIPLKFRVEVEPARDGVHVCPVGELDLDTVGELRAQLEEVRSAGYTRLILDLRRTSFMDSSGLRVALDVYSDSAADGFEFGIVPGPPAVQRPFAVAGLSARLPFIEPRS